MAIPPRAPVVFPSWRAYVTVDDVDAIAHKAQELGARTLVPLTDVPDVGRFYTFQDPQGFECANDRTFADRPGAAPGYHLRLGGDTAGQGWGINPEWGGMRIYEQMRRLQPDFFIHNGDSIYADNPIAAEVKLDDGTIWKNVTTPEKAKVAETLGEFRGNYVYNLMDEHIRAFNAEVTQYFQWDDHEVTNNWFPGGVIDDRNPRYQQYMVKSHDLLAANAKRAFLEYLPLRLDPQDPERIYRAFNYGPSLDVFMLDEQSYRGPNSANRQEASSAATAFLGMPQLRWLKRALLASNAT